MTDECDAASRNWIVDGARWTQAQREGLEWLREKARGAVEGSPS